MGQFDTFVAVQVTDEASETRNSLNACFHFVFASNIPDKHHRGLLLGTEITGSQPDSVANGVDTSIFQV